MIVIKLKPILIIILVFFMNDIFYKLIQAGLSVDIVSLIDIGSKDVKFRIFCMKRKHFWAIKF